jgi:hypothetical protein
MRSRPFCLHVPHQSFIDPFSASAAKTLIVTLQGAQALVLVAFGSIQSTTRSSYQSDVSLATMFQPLAILGLLRLPAALWMSDVYAYQYGIAEDGGLSEASKLMGNKTSTEVARTASGISPMTQNEETAVRFRPIHGIYGIMTRLFYLITMSGLSGYTTYFLFPSWGLENLYESVTVFAHIAFFAYFLLTTTFIFMYYILRGK